MADVIRIVKSTEEVVGKNNHVLKSLELKMTRVLKDAMGRSHTTTSTISLDTILSQVDIERMLTNSGSTLNLTLTDMSDDSASIIVVPDSLSLVDCASARIKFPSNATKDQPNIIFPRVDPQNDIDSVLDYSPPSSTTAETPAGEADGITVESHFGLDDNVSNTSKHADEKNITRLTNTIAQQIIEHLRLSKSSSNSYSKKRMPGSRLIDYGEASDPLSTTALNALLSMST
ncbi:hypothetical protein TSTA_109210 [Talaromyces stipitatus ATCC 10500]|uniref:Uncharacterized protein n=1 Tax=Talaromyces stipitatus (strain ATCC 10500 / CBS 375.48 / QM 6759 / NRRL 1006) TaxID=441959 RepID=B8MUX4_TALSN|nr:uncharacterized protein TSTA_109210 [Talaromyces stipitatus ATCC 10500]EED11742.1 hypothetical protein TSTA_109210 [Talaromyces stipitatus ATCC 10500]